tara:strand:- start:265 stop:1161 length:897 start_codon:yes stop_codon:yes gene_type:complete
MIITNHFSNKNQILLSVIFMIAASFSFACGSIATKVLGSSLFFESINPFQIVHARFFFSFIFLFLLSFIFKTSLKTKLIKIHGLRSCLGLMGISIWFTSLLYIPASDATAINFLNPIFAMFFAIYILKEKIDFVRWLGAIVSLLGGLCLIRPSLDLSFSPIALLCMMGAIIMGLEIICIKYLSQRENIFKILLLNNLIASVIASVFLPVVFKIPSLIEFLGMIFIAFCFLIGQFFFLNSMKRADASFIMPFFYSTLIFVILFDLIIFNFMPDAISFIGASIIFFGALIISYREIKSKY